MTSSLKAAKTLISRCIQLRNQGVTEHVLRSELHSRLRSLFPSKEDEGWVNHYTEGTEKHIKVTSKKSGKEKSRFIDTLVNATVIEFEPDLRKLSKRKEGYRQVIENISGRIREGTPVSQIRGVLSDTVEWYVFDVSIREGIDLRHISTANISLHEIDRLKLIHANEAEAKRLIQFFQRHLARKQSRTLNAINITLDLGLDSMHFSQNSSILIKLIQSARKKDNSVNLATELWTKFVDHLERKKLSFRCDAYAAEVYMVILSRLLSANVLAGKALLSDDEELLDILAGQFFETNFNLANMVEHDYFVWLLNPPFIRSLLPIACEMQFDLYAYDFTLIPDEDLFGHIMAQLANHTHRKLLGLEWTPTWLARLLAQKSIQILPKGEIPQFIDMCCGSGAIIKEILNEVRKKFPKLSFSRLCQSITGFDIDPLAVILAKTTWVVTMADDLKSNQVRTIIPIFHADSLFAVTPVSKRMPLPGETKDIQIDMDGVSIALPAILLDPNYRHIFDEIVDWIYDMANYCRKKGNISIIKKKSTKSYVVKLLDKHKRKISTDILDKVVASIFSLACRMSHLALTNRNGIWAFILRNTYRPGLLTGQFNGVISNPPWLAMSQLADNPYCQRLTDRARIYGIKPSGASHLHLELATTFLMHAIDRYLHTNAVIACLVPGTIFNGHHQQLLRDGKYLTSSRPIPFEILEVWEIERGTFKVRSAALIGRKKQHIKRVRRGPKDAYHALPSGIKKAKSFEVASLGKNRTAWLIDEAKIGAVPEVDESMPDQGADIMPRTAVCVEITSRKGTEYKVRTPSKTSPLYFAVKDAKKLKNHNFAGWVSPDYLYKMVQSLNLLPFTLDGNFVPIAIPAKRDTKRRWIIQEPNEILAGGFVQTSRRFADINKAMKKAKIGKQLQEKINERNKLTAQVFTPRTFLVLNGTSGGVSCAAYLPVNGNEELVIDQTLYWRIVDSEKEALYRVGMLNSKAITEAVSAFNPAGEFGERHLHTLPNRIIPTFDAKDKRHKLVYLLTKQLMKEARLAISKDKRIAEPSSTIASRRRRLRLILESTSSFSKLNTVCKKILGIK